MKDKRSKHISSTWKDGGKGHYTNKDEMYINYIAKKFPNFQANNAVEMGPGSGRFALKLIDKYSIRKYVLLDLEKNIFDAHKFLTSRGFKNVELVYSQNYEKLFDRPIDFFVANVVVPETPHEYRTDLLNNIIPNCNQAMIISHLWSKKLNMHNYAYWILELFNENFDVVDYEKTNYKNCYCLTGYKK